MKRPKPRPTPVRDLGALASGPVAWWWRPQGRLELAGQVVHAQTWFEARALARAESSRAHGVGEVCVWIAKEVT